MTTFPFYPNIPDGPNNPSFDQPNMKINNQSDYSIWNVDHLTYDQIGSGGVGTSAGQHKFVTFNNVATPAAVIDPLSIAYTQIGSAISTAELFFKNANATFLISAIKAFGVFAAAGGVLQNSYNVVSVTGNNPWTITLDANVVTGNNIIAFFQASANASLPLKWTFANPVITLSSNIGVTGNISFVVLQY